MRRKIITAVLLIMAAFCLSADLFAQSGSNWELRLMPQVAFGTKNNVKRPGDSGTRISLGDELNRKNNAVFSPRIELEYSYNRHHIIATAALLRDRFEGMSARPLLYNNTLFEAGSNIDANYRFNTYRLGYRYRLVDRPKAAFELGATVLLRNAVISLENADRRSSFYNTGVAPLLSYFLEWNVVERFSLLSYGDAFAVKAGRAEDIFAGVKYRFTSLISAMAGYRLLEGGSDSDRIYTMATFHYLSLGIGFNF